VCLSGHRQAFMYLVLSRQSDPSRYCRLTVPSFTSATMTETGRCEPPLQIPTLVTRGFSSLKTLLGTLEDSPAECWAAASHLARLKLWAANLGAHRPSGTRSLEYRLRDASSIRNHIVSLLQDLCEAIDEGVIGQPDPAIQSAQHANSPNQGYLWPRGSR
jgi:hypothetical protein